MNPIPNSAALLGLTLALGCGAKSTARIAIDSTRTYQTINGWEATIAIDDDGLNPTTRDSLIAVAVDQYGITRLRLQAQGNVIESVDHSHYPPELAIGSNDNDDPNVMVPDRFWWQIFDRHVKDYVLPVKARVEARGDRFILNVCFVGFRASSRFLQEDPAEYVEFMLAVLSRLKAAYSTPLEPDLWEMRLEPDNGAVRMSPDQMGDYLVAAGNAARKAGFEKMRFSMPSTKDPNLVPEYVQGVLKHPGAAAYVTELSYHRYRTPLPATFDQLRSLGKEQGWTTAMLEHIRGDHRELAEDLTKANVSAWAQYTLVGPHRGDNGGHYFYSDSTAGTWKVGHRSPALAQFFNYVRPGATRVEATSNDPELVPVAFRRPDGRFVTVISSTGGARADLTGLPAGNYAITFAGADGQRRE
ncbi:MAG TPA: glycoside hydrolase family 30 beta sandwich domain-containing protein, partial [Gemmatimonadales bacterium]|nr:glycoside hydrolase family 30 beta sandwich domain-containing protein [Gemmatimonadales bacterium]